MIASVYQVSSGTGINYSTLRMDLRAQAMTKIFKHRLQVFAAYEQPLCLFAIRCAEQMTIAYIPGVVHPVTAFCYFFLYEFEMFQIVRVSNSAISSLVISVRFSVVRSLPFRRPIK